MQDSTPRPAEKRARSLSGRLWMVIACVVVAGASLLNRDVVLKNFITVDDVERARARNVTGHQQGLPVEPSQGNVDAGYFNVTETTDATAFVTPDSAAAATTTDTEEEVSLINPGAPVSLVVQLGGAMGNNLCHLAHAKVVQLHAWKRFGIDTKLVLRHQDSVKWSQTARNIQKCFPSFRNADFSAGNTNELDQRRELQKELLGETQALLLDVSSENETELDEGLAYLKEILTNETLPSPDPRATITVPFLFANSLWTPISPIYDQYFPHVREFLRFDDNACCAMKPDDDESVFHLRASFKEFRNNNHYAMGYEELSPNKTAFELFADLQPGDKVAIVTPMAGENISYVDAFRSRGMKTRIVVQKAVQDFCFLLHAKKELVGSSTSTFTWWAAALNEAADKIRLYSVDSPWRRSRGEDDVFIRREWDPSDIRSRIRFELYQSEELQEKLLSQTRLEEGGAVSQEHEPTQTNQTEIQKQKRSSSENITVPGAEMRNASLVLRLGGELGNQLQILAMGEVFKIILKEKYQINTDVVLMHQNKPKWKSAAENTQACFNNTRSMDFSAANTDEYTALNDAQNGWLGANVSRLKLDASFEEDDLESALSYWRELLDTAKPPEVELKAPTRISLPFLYVDQAYIRESYVDQYYDMLKSFMAFDEAACCKLKPDPDETVLHIRMFLVEMPRKGKAMGFEELSPSKIASELLGNLKEGDKVAVLSRFGGDHVKPYVEALEKRGLQARAISGQSATEDFCFLLHAQKELVGIRMSTYARWASFLGHMKTARLYDVDSPVRRRIYGEDSGFFNYSWTHPELRDRIRFELYKSEEQDAAEESSQ